MQIRIEGNEKYFDEVVAMYDKMRPEYVPELYDDIFGYKQIDSSSNVLEIGIGTGQATGPILNTGCMLTAVELGEKLAEYVKCKFKRIKSCSIINKSFEQYECESNYYDLIYSATAFHWIPEETGYRKVYNILKPGGLFARFANNPGKDSGRPRLHEAIQQLYAQYMPAAGPHKEERNYEEEARQKAVISSKYGFVDTRYMLYKRTREFMSEEYVCLLNTYSDHLALEEQVRKEFYKRIVSVIDEHGGRIAVYDTIDLELAQKPACMDSDN